MTPKKYWSSQKWIAMGFRCATFSIIETSFDRTGYGQAVIGTTRDCALKQGVPAQDVEAWESDLRLRTAEGE
jgi:hypothetical protein